MKPKPWEQRLVDESCDNELQSLHKKAKEWEAKYLTALPRPGRHHHMETVAMECSGVEGKQEKYCFKLSPYGYNDGFANRASRQLAM